MKALVWKEIRELAPGFWLLLGTCWAVGVVDVVYNWREDRGAGMSLLVCALVSLVAALLAGANSYARESREQIVFLGKWPISRWRIWLAKALVPAVMWAALVALAASGCVGMLALRGHTMSPLEAFNIGKDGWIFPAMWALLYGIGLLTTVAVPSAMGATVVTVIGVGGTVWAYLWAWDFVPVYFGPRLGLLLPESDEASHLIPALVVAAICLIVSAVVATRALYRAPRRRMVAAAGGLLGTMALALLVAAGVWVAVQGRFPRQFSGSIDGTGHYLLLVEDSGVGGYDEGSLWALDLVTGGLRRIALGGGNLIDWAADAPVVAMHWPAPSEYRDYAWLADLSTGELWRTEAEGWSVALSPDGKWLASRGDEWRVFPAREGEPIPLDVPQLDRGWSSFVTWRQDGRALYMHGSEHRGEGVVVDQTGPTLLLEVDPFAGTPARVIARVPPPWDLRGIPLGTHFAGFWQARETEDAVGLLVDLRTGRQIEVQGSVSGMDVTAGGEYVWSREWTGHENRLLVLDTETGETVRVIEPEDVGGRRLLNPNASRHGPHVLVYAAYKSERDWWLADPDGSDLRRLPIERGEEVLGWSAQGEIILLRGRIVEALDPETGQRRLIRELPGTEARSRE